MCAIGTCAIGTCAIGTCAIGTCAVGTCAIGTCAIGTWAIEIVSVLLCALSGYGALYAVRYRDMVLFTWCAIGILRHLVCVLSGCALSGCALSGITINLLCAIGMCAIAPCASGFRSFCTCMKYVHQSSEKLSGRGYLNKTLK